MEFVIRMRFNVAGSSPRGETRYWIEGPSGFWCDEIGQATKLDLGRCRTMLDWFENWSARYGFDFKIEPVLVSKA